MYPNAHVYEINKVFGNLSNTATIDWPWTRAAHLSTVQLKALK